MVTEEKRKKQKILITAVAVILVAAAIALHYLLDPWGFYRKVSPTEAALRTRVLDTALAWTGSRESNGSHKPIIDLYNSHEPLAMDYEVQYTDSWCAVFVSAVSIECGITQILPTECGCERQIGLFQSLGRWQESDRHIPLPGDVIFYDWDETECGECDGWSDHVGLVVGTKWPFLKVIEGNCDDQVKTRVILLGDKTIRGYGLPDYASLAP